MSDEQREALVARISNTLRIPLAILALIWVAVIALEFSEVLDPGLRVILEDLDIAIWLVFLLEFLVEFLIAPHKGRYLRTHWFTALAVLVPFFRVLRLVTVFWAVRSLWVANAILGANRAARRARNVLRRFAFQYVLILVLITLFVGTTGVYLLERAYPQTELRTYGATLWWAASLMTTINTSTDPVSPEGQVLAILMRIVALSFFGYVTATIASVVLGQTVSTEEQIIGRLAGMQQQLDALNRRNEELAALLEQHTPQH